METSLTKDALRKRKSRAKETLEETCDRRSKAATGMARFRANLSDDEKKKRKEANAARMRQAREKKKSKNLPSNSETESSQRESSLVRKRKPIDFTMADLEDYAQADSDEEFIANVKPSTSRRELSKRLCNENSNIKSGCEVEETYSPITKATKATKRYHKKSTLGRKTKDAQRKFDERKRETKELHMARLIAIKEGRYENVSKKS